MVIEGRGFGWLVKNNLRGSAVERGMVLCKYCTEPVCNLTISVAHLNPSLRVFAILTGWITG